MNCSDCWYWDPAEVRGTQGLSFHRCRLLSSEVSPQATSFPIVIEVEGGEPFHVLTAQTFGCAEWKAR